MKSKSSIAVATVALSWFLTGSLFAQTGAAQELVKSSNPAAASAPATATPAAASAPPVAATANVAPVAVRPRFVPVLLSVTDAGGNPVASLTKEQLTLTDSNQPVQPLQVFKGHDIPPHLGIVLVSSLASFSQQQAAAVNLVQRVVRPNIDEAFVVTARGKKPWPYDRLEWKKDPAELSKMIQGLDRDAGLPDAFNFEMKTDSVAFDENAGRNTLQTFGGGGITVFDAIYAMMNSDPRPARRVLVIFREPWAHSPGFGRRANGTVESQLLRVIAQAQGLHVATFVIGLEDSRFNGVTDNTIGQTYISLHAGDDGGAGTATRNFDREMEQDRMRAYNAGRSNVERMAAETGGVTVWSAKKNYPDAVNAIANQLDGQYMVTFVPGDVPGPMHTLQVTSSNGAHVLAQKAFFYAAAR
jgi:VWFA-related protein